MPGKVPADRGHPPKDLDPELSAAAVVSAGERSASHTLVAIAAPAETAGVPQAAHTATASGLIGITVGILIDVVQENGRNRVNAPLVQTIGARRVTGW
jgi:hypothetical protein